MKTTDSLREVFEQRIRAIVFEAHNKALNEWNLNPYYHQAMAERFSDGSDVYYKKEIDKLLGGVSQSPSNISSYWLQIGTPNLSIDDVVNFELGHLNTWCDLLYSIQEEKDVNKCVDDTLKLISEQQYDFWVIYFRYDSFVKAANVLLLDKRYIGIAKAFSKYISGATDEVIQSIVEKHSLPANAPRPRWIDNNKSDASRFAFWFGMKEAAFNKCFDGIRISPNNRTQSDGLITPILKLYKN